MKLILAILSAGVFCWSCGTSQKASIKQGITGNVMEIRGNQMPSPDAPASNGTPLSTTIYVYELTNAGQGSRVGTSGMYKSLDTKPVMEIQSDSTGRFKIALPPGRYSLFLKVKDHFYASSFDTENNIAPVIVEKRRVAKVTLLQKAAATF